MHATTTAHEIRRLALEGALSIYTAADTKPRLSVALQGAIALEINLSGIGEFDCAGLQLLLATREQARRQDIELRLLGANAVVRELLTLSGLTDLLTDPEVN
ncbi:STAS domain-containing protein [Ectopseudomonas composti]